MNFSGMDDDDEVGSIVCFRCRDAQVDGASIVRELIMHRIIPEAIEQT
jgi:hypothetical protein